MKTVVLAAMTACVALAVAPACAQPDSGLPADQPLHSQPQGYEQRHYNPRSSDHGQGDDSGQMDQRSYGQGGIDPRSSGQRRYDQGRDGAASYNHAPAYAQPQRHRGSRHGRQPAATITASVRGAAA